MPSPTISKRRRRLFALIAFLLPFVVLAGVEAVLRFKGYGGYPDFFRPVGELPDNGALHIVEPAASKPYFFANPERPGYADQSHFLMPKPRDTIRVFLFGESAAKGYPQPPNLAVSSFLESLWEKSMPGKSVEVINLGTTAISSLPIRYMVAEAARYKPDLFIFYTGNNEFFGAYGVASINAAGPLPSGALPWLRAARGTALVQALDGWIHEKADANVTLMEEMMARAFIPHDSSLREAAARNLESNLGASLSAAASYGIPVLVCTTASNEAGLAPIGEDDFSPLSGEKKQAAIAEFNAIVALVDTDPGAAVPRLQAFLKTCPQHASTTFHLGRSWAALGDTQAARTSFLAARDLDAMPWRPTSATEEAICRAARQHHMPLCDIASEFRNLSPEGATSWALLDDHVHLSLRGQIEAARLILQSISTSSQLASSLRPDPSALAGLPDWKSLAAEHGSNEYDDYRVNHTLRVLFGVPFMRQSNPAAFARYQAEVDQAESRMNPEIRHVCRDWQTAIPHAGGVRPLTGMVARVLLRRNESEDAQRFYQIAQSQVPAYTSWHLEYRYFDLACRLQIEGALDEKAKAFARDAIAEGVFLLSKGFTGTGLTERHVGRLHQLLHEYQESIPYLEAARRHVRAEDLVACDQALVLSYVRTGRIDDALALARQGLRLSGSFAPAYQQMLGFIEAER
jgi:tetratricopeptide (TPR) repeat protein